jgi:hypothetical protein
VVSLAEHEREGHEMLEIILAASLPCITIADYGPLLNMSIAEITQVWPYGDPGNSFVWTFKDGTQWAASFRHDGCLSSHFVVNKKMADELVRLLGDGI